MPKIRKPRQKYHAPAPPYSPSSPSGCDKSDISTSASSSLSSLGISAPSKESSASLSATQQKPRDGSSPGKRGDEVQRTIQEEKTRKVEEALDTSFAGLSKGQRRRLAKREAWLRKFDFVTYAEQARQRKEREERFLRKNGGEEGSSLLNLQSVRQQLECIDTSHKSQHDGAGGGGSGKLSRKRMHKLAEKELKQYEAVWKFPAFQSDPFGSLRVHLTNSLNLQKSIERERKSGQEGAGKKEKKVLKTTGKK